MVKESARLRALARNASPPRRVLRSSSQPPSKAIQKKGIAKRIQKKATKAGKTKVAKKVTSTGGGTKLGKQKPGKKGKEKKGKGTPAPKNVFNDELGTYGLEYEAEALIDSKVYKGARSYLVKWAGYPASSNTWEPEVNLRNSTELIAEFDEKYPDKP